jgi:hypothetical protein
MNGGFAALRVWAEMFQDAQQTRIAATNRLSRGELDSAWYESHVTNLEKTEHDCALNLRRTFRKVAPAEVVTWQKSTIGIGEHQLARLLGHIGHPVKATPKFWNGSGKGGRVLVEGEPFDRRVGELWSYCGHGDPSRKRRAGMTADEAAALGRPLAKSLVFQMAESCVKNVRSPYREVYDKARVEYENRLHAEKCVRCGPSGKPAEPGSEWSKAHQHAAALRKVGKEILRDLWRVTQGMEPSWQ